MLNLKQIFYTAFALCALIACSSEDSTVAGTTTIPNASAEITSSSEENDNSSSSSEVVANSSDVVESSSDKVAISSSSINGPVDAQDIVFSTEATSKKPLPRGEVVVYGEEKGAMASCSAGSFSNKKSFMAKISVINGYKMERTLSLRNFGSACDSIYNAFKESCPSDFLLVASDAACSATDSRNNNGNLKVFCFASSTASNMLCDTQGKCSLARDTAGVDFDAIVEAFTKESDDICSHIAEGVDTAEYAIPTSEPDSSIKANSGRVFILEPNTDQLDVSEEERVILDSLASAFPETHTFDEVEEMTHYINRDAEYNFTTEGKKFTQNSSLCEGYIYEEESGVRRENTFSSQNGTLYATTIRYDNAIVYLVRVLPTLALTAKEIWDTFLEECNATNGSFYDYRPYENFPSVACAVKNYTGIPFSTIVSEQANFCEISHTKFDKPTIILD
jgi:hypothetical protein